MLPASSDGNSGAVTICPELPSRLSARTQQGWLRRHSPRAGAWRFFSLARAQHVRLALCAWLGRVILRGSNPSVRPVEVADRIPDHVGLPIELIYLSDYVCAGRPLASASSRNLPTSATRF